MFLKQIELRLNDFNRKWKKEKKSIVHLPNFVEQFFYLYDETLIYDETNGLENLKLFADLLQRFDISDLRLQWFRLENDVCFFCCIYKEKSEYYMEYKSNGFHKKVTFKKLIKHNRIIEKKKIEVIIDWVND